MTTRPSAEQRRTVRQRAQNCCEYCLVSELLSAVTHEVDHIIAEKHGGLTEVGNLALSCVACNRRKGSDIASLDPQSGSLVPLFNPRDQIWHEHFEISGVEVLGRTEIGRTTVHFLQLNAEQRLIERSAFIAAGLFPPEFMSRKPR